MEEDEECDYDPILIDDSIAPSDDKESLRMGEDNSNMCDDVVIKTKTMHLQVEYDLHEDVELQSEVWHVLDMLIDEYENVKMLSQSNVRSILA